MTKRILNLGAGTQSSVLAVMADRGDIEPVDLAIFSDTQAEPREVYDHLDWLESQLKNTPVVRVTAGNLEADAIMFRQYRRGVYSTGRSGAASIPLFVLNPDQSQGIVRRQCTKEYKLDPIYRYIRKDMLGLEKGERVHADTMVTQVFGISFDERQRMRRPEAKWQTYEYPLVDMKLNRWQVIELAEKWFPDRTFPRSACVFCPYKSNEEWRRLRDELPEEWDRAVAFDSAIRDADAKGKAEGKVLVGLPFVHRQMVPLDEADLRSNDEKQGQLTLTGFANECEGMCGV